MTTVNIVLGITGLIIAMAGVFIEPIILRAIVVFMGLMVASMRIN